MDRCPFFHVGGRELKRLRGKLNAGSELTFAGSTQRKPLPKKIDDAIDGTHDHSGFKEEKQN
jgi:hypothetical protein